METAPEAPVVQSELPGMDSGPDLAGNVIDLSSIRDAADQPELSAPESADAVSHSDYSREGGPAPWEQPLAEAAGDEKVASEQEAPAEKPKKAKAEKAPKDKAVTTGAPPWWRPPLPRLPRFPVTLPAPERKKLCISISRSSFRSRIIPLAYVTTRKCSPLWKASRLTA